MCHNQEPTKNYFCGSCLFLFNSVLLGLFSICVVNKAENIIMGHYLLWQHEYRKRWITYSEEEIQVLNKAVENKQTSVSLPNKNTSKQVVADFEKMVQKNQATLYEQRIRCLVSSSGFYVWLWKNNSEWCFYKPNLTILLEVAHSKGDKELKFHDNDEFEINIDSLEQLNKKTHEICPIKREKIEISTTIEIKSVKELKAAQIAKFQPKKAPSNKRKHTNGTSDNNTSVLSNNGMPASSFNPLDIEEDDDSSFSSDASTKVPVDLECPDSKSYHIYCGSGTIYSATLNQTNLQNNNNKYYIIQLLEHNQKKQFAVWRRWGRVGNKGQRDFTNYGSSFAEAKISFEKKFYDKTRNEWDNIKNFEHVHGKYDLLHMDLNPESEVKKLKKSVKCSDSKLPTNVQALMEIICDRQRMEDMMKEMSYDSNKTPLGKLTLKQVKDGYIALSKISAIIANEKSGSALINACNDFYTKIPHNFGMKTPPLIRTQTEINAKLVMLEALSNIAVAMGVLNTSSNAIEHPLDMYYNTLNCALEVLDSESPEYSELDMYLKGTHGSTHSSYDMEIIDAFKCSKSEQELAFKDSDNILLLWHGSRISNWLGILKEGLRIAPPEAPVTGYMFGKGVYFADTSSKSANYCFATRQKNEGILVLSEVSVGKQFVLYQSDGNLPSTLPAGFDSVLGKGRVDPSKFKDSALSTKAKVACGPLVENNLYQGALHYNEYIVYDVKQIKMKYLLRIRFNYK